MIKKYKIKLYFKCIYVCTAALLSLKDYTEILMWAMKILKGEPISELFLIDIGFLQTRHSGEYDKFVSGDIFYFGD